MQMQWDKLNWPILDRLREGFLSGAAANGPYWKSLEDLAQYDLTYAERIGWKWDAVLRELKWRRWSPALLGNAEPLTLVDWGCGSGIAGRRVIEAFGVEHFRRLEVWDHSPLAREFAANAARKAFPGLEVGEFDARAESDIDLLVVSHVINELSAANRAVLLALVRRARATIWVEPGTRPVSRDLASIRDELRQTLRIVAPCTHAAPCGLFAPENAEHWCHYFADPPPSIYADSDWVRFGQRAGIDLRSLPYSFLVTQNPAYPFSDDAFGASRILGRPEHFKGYADILNCDAEGVQPLQLQKRVDPAFFKELKRTSDVPIYRWTREGGRIVGIEKDRRLQDDGAPPSGRPA
ncbi:MAG TPA: small ribosomal subunit Rsm22 family protein [Opitutaceae bacterium]|nr:small ribosomal subunit Rsm22 family protein [Opitutaceae bacterium]